MATSTRLLTTTRGIALSNDADILKIENLCGGQCIPSVARASCTHNDKDLHVDFKNKRLIDEPRGKVYSTNEDKNFTNAHEKLLKNRNLCRTSISRQYQITLRQKQRGVH